MSETGMLRKLACMLGGCGMLLFVISGLFPGWHPDGAIGLDVTRNLFGLPVTSGIYSRWIVAASMAMGVMASGIMFITVVATGGWLISTALYILKTRRR